MVTVRVVNHLDDLARDTRRIATTARAGMARVVRDSARDGNRLARTSARRTAGKHGKHYANRFSAEKVTPLAYTYGPKGRPQGEMSFEFGSRNQPPHLDLARSADVVGPKLARDAQDALGRLFW